MLQTSAAAPSDDQGPPNGPGVGVDAPGGGPQDTDDRERTPIVGTIADDKVIIVTPDGMGVASRRPTGQGASGADGIESPDQAREADRAGGADGSHGEDGVEGVEGASTEQRRPTNPADLVEEPAKVMRIGSMIKQLLEEVRGAPLDEKGRARLAEIHDRSIAELKDGLAPELVAELDRIALPFKDDEPSDAELRIAQAQLVGWLEGLFHGIQTALVAQQMAAQAQLQQMRALPPGHPAAGPGSDTGAAGIPGMGGAPGTSDNSPKSPNGGTGQYL